MADVSFQPINVSKAMMGCTLRPVERALKHLVLLWASRFHQDSAGYRRADTSDVEVLNASHPNFQKAVRVYCQWAVSQKRALPVTRQIGLFSRFSQEPFTEALAGPGISPRPCNRPVQRVF